MQSQARNSSGKLSGRVKAAVAEIRQREGSRRAVDESDDDESIEGAETENS